MPSTYDDDLLEPLLNAWDRNNTILLNLLHAVPPELMDARAHPDSPSIAKMFTHIHYVRLIFVSEDAPEFAREMPEDEWRNEHDAGRIMRMLNESARAVRDAVDGRLKSRKPMNQHYDHPILFLQHMIWHEGYHHGQTSSLSRPQAGRSPTTMSGPAHGASGWTKLNVVIAVRTRADYTAPHENSASPRTRIRRAVCPAPCPHSCNHPSAGLGQGSPRLLIAPS